MKKNYFLLISVLSVAALASCNGTPSSSSVGSSGTSSVTSSETLSSEATKPTTATGAYSYLGKTYEERTDILGLLESYAMNNYLTGLPLFENGGYVMYNPRIQKGTENYIVNYGFGILSEGTITSDMEAETNTAYKKYLHTWDASDPASINALNTDGSQIADLYSYISSSYWGNKMNATKDGYEWYGVLAKEDRPIAVNRNPATGLASKWKFHVRTGEDGLKYATGSSKRTAWNGRNVEIEDYINAFKLLLTQSNGQYRGAELASQTGATGIKGAAAYFKASAKGATEEQLAAAWEGVGIKSGKDDGGYYLEIELAGPTTDFYAMYNLSSGLYEPVPAAFIEEIGGVANYGGYSSDKSTTPVDNILSLAPYYLESWTAGQLITFKKNDSWFERLSTDTSISSRYSIPGVHVSILAGYATDKTIPFKEFLAGKLDSSSIPSDYLADYKTDPRTTSVPGDSVFKLNVNSCTEEQWIEKFGENGSICQTTTDKYWDIKPWMSNSDFLDAMLYSINRFEIATKYGSVPSCDYFGTAYMSNPEEGVSYNSTPQHKQALVKAGLEDEAYLTDSSYERTYGYDLEASRALFERAAKTLVDEGKCKSGDTLNVDIWWMYEYQTTQIGSDVKTYLENAFNTSAANTTYGLTLQINNEAGTNWYDVYYDHLMVGQFDLGFGSIDGNALNPLNFMEVLKSDNSSTFTLNWGPDTSVVSEDLVYDGKIWSYDTLWKAADQGVLVKDSVEIPPVVLTFGYDGKGYVVNEDGSVTFSVTYTLNNTKEALGETAENVDECSVEIIDWFVYGPYTDDAVGVEATQEGSTVSFTLDAETAAELIQSNKGYLAVGCDYSVTILGAISESYTMELLLVDSGTAE